MTRKKIKIVGISLVLAGLIYAGWDGYHNFFFLKTDKAITLRLRIVEDACGGCFPPWKIDSVFIKDEKHQNLLEKEIEVVYKGKA